MTTSVPAHPSGKRHSHASTSHQQPTRPYNLAAGYLRAALIALVVAHHSVLAYLSFVPPRPRSLGTQPQWWLAFPVSDRVHWSGFDLLAGFNDLFFMSLLFFLSGLFLWSSLERKGIGRFLRDRAWRLGIPFLVAVGLLAPLAYFPSYLLTGHSAGLSGFANDWVSLGHLPPGPAWFLAVLLAYDCAAAALSVKLPHWGPSLGRAISCGCRTPAALFALLVSLSAAVYLPMALAVGPMRWTAFGPFTFQTSRIFHYAAYFVMGVALGALGLDRSLLARGGQLAARWPLWLAAALGAFLLNVAISLTALSVRAQSPGWTALVAITFVLSCAASSFACLACFARFAVKRSRVLESLRDNSYGIYLLHYVFVTWLQYALLKTILPAFAKGGLVFIGTLALSWATVAALRRIPAVARVI